MSRGNGHNRTAPFPGFSRGMLIGENGKPKPEAPPAGKYFYQVPILIQREGLPMEADTFQVDIPQPMEGVRFSHLHGQIAGHLKEAKPDLPEPKVVCLPPFFLGFVPQEQLDRQAAEAKAAAEKAAADGGSTEPAPAEPGPKLVVVE